jgi:membrane associated rhomboid family serine protease
MFPVRDTIQSKNYPIVTHSLIAINVICFLIQISQGQDFDRFAYLYGLVPARYTVPQVASYFTFAQQAFAFISFMFLHGGFMHILGNMWFLYIFGDNVEDRLGPFRYFLFYILCGFLSGLSHFFLNLHSNIPTIGASGAIAGVMGAYFILHPTSRILTLVPVLIIPFFFEIPAFFFIGIWFIFQFINATASHGDISGIAWWAHIGGFVFGIILLKIFRAFPSTGLSNHFRHATEKKKTFNLQVIRPTGRLEDPHLYGTIHVSPYEIKSGTRKLVNIPWGFQKRLYNVVIPPGVEPGSNLRLKNLGKIKPDGQRGDLFLKVVVEKDIFD